MFSLSLVLTLILLNSSLLISANGDRGHGGHDDDDDDDYCRRTSRIVTACEGLDLVLSCPRFRKIHILAANYGRTDRRTCVDHRPWGQIRNTNCISRNSLYIVSRSCDGHRSCTISATNSVFSDPCVGTYKFLRVKYCCKRRRG
ncbi:L-rhamnose-binding lectin ELEL-1-like [Danio aesculapii]|uniref:L-rhamnose-binding lectin ELEL-1-like n=1 Tax=Danio aesculapii TaxID=1142201 RepID=UPI0024BF97F3|nr:L-rhamnose-binding lectin ELEL-1-like [Danio aesculapii]